jgi:hypothetical protein
MNMANKSSVIGSQGIIASALMIFGMFGASQPAKALIPVFVTNCQPSSGAVPTLQCASESTLAALLIYTQTGIAPTIASASPFDDGTIGQQKLLNDALAKMSAQLGESTPNSDKAARIRDYQNKLMDIALRDRASTSPRACSDATAGSGMTGGYSGGGGAPAGLAAAKEKAIVKAQNDRATEPRKDIKTLEEVVANPDYCNANEATAKFPACKGEGALPGADVDPGSLFIGAVKGTAKTNESFDVTQIKAADSYIRLSMPSPAPNLPGNVATTPAGAQYMAYRRRYNSRVEAVAGALAFISSQRTPLPVNHPFVATWNNLKAEYGITFPDRKIPDAPSAAELSRFFVMQQFDSKMMEDDLKTDPGYLANRQLNLLKYQNLLLMGISDRLDRNNVLQAQILANQIDPVNQETMMQRRSSVSGN